MCCFDYQRLFVKCQAHVQFLGIVFLSLICSEIEELDVIFSLDAVHAVLVKRGFSFLQV